MGRIDKAALIGGGVIGAGWAARFVLNGIDVAIFDPDPELQRKVETVLGNARRAWAKLFPGAALPAEGKVRYARSIADAVAGARFVQESLPEREDLKRRILAEIDALLPADVIIGSSTSGLLPSRLQADMAHPERLVVGHPFNPVYLLPLVEICGGDRTSDAVKTRAAEFYRAIGMQPLHVRKEIDGFIADRLLEAVWREALWLVNDGVATTEEIDDAIRYGAGLRWSFMGTFLIYRLAGGEPGMRHFLSQFGPTLKLPWTRLEAPELTDELTDLIARQSDDQAQGISIRELEQRRDDCLVSVLSALRENDFAAGATIRRYAAALVDETGVLTLHHATVKPEWIDYNGHMTEHRYLEVFGDTTDALLRHVGADARYLASGFMYYTVETHIRHLKEVRQGEALHVTTQILGADDKRIHLFHSIYRTRDQALLATAEQMMLHVDSKAGKAVPASADVLDRVRRLAQAQKTLPIPEASGRRVALP
jgi:carnitine 3-dehydrogenase